MKITERQLLGSAPIGQLLRAFAIPSIISMVVSTLYNIVDQIFIGRGVGYLGNGATNVILPITVIALALGLMIGDGATAYFSLCLGQKELKNAAQGVGNALTLTIIVSMALTVGSFVWLQPLCVLFGATESCAEKVFSEKNRSELVSLSPNFGRYVELFRSGKAKNSVGTNEMGNARFGEIWHTFLEKCKI